MRIAKKPPGYSWYSYFNNALSMIGLCIALIAGIFHLSLFVLDFSRGLYNPYLNIWFHIIIPPFVVAGFAIALYGAWKERRRLRKAGFPAQAQVKVPPGKALILGGTISIALLIPFLGFTSYSGYKYTDSVEFCGQACHVPMQAVFTAYQVSPHARVPCSSCHIGEGASWFVRSKLSGTRQVFATAFDTFHRPIKTPIVDLRPARETCERCHWPEKNFGSKVVDLPHYSSDEANTYRPLSMLLKTGGGNPDLAPVRGIHWHLIPTHSTEYVAVDEKRLEIPWVKVINKEEGTSVVFRSDGLPADAPPPDGEKREMDCLDCHNRPSHKYRTPDEILNELFFYKRIDSTFPFLKREAGNLMARPYKDTPEARAAISRGLKDYYDQNYPEIAADRRDELDSSIEAIIQAFEKNIFPEMKADWRTHPDHIGHKYYPGCYRCHDNRHIAADGSVISKECGQCHEFMEHKEIEGGKALVQGKYNHPYTLEESHKDIDCYTCHDGKPTPPPTCAGCHWEITEFIAGKAAALDAPSVDPHPHQGELECVDCHDEAKTIPQDEIISLCVDCHDEEFETTVKTLLADLADALSRKAALQQNEGDASTSTPGDTVSKTLEFLERIHPIHNPGYALRILRVPEKEPGKNLE